MRKKKLKSSVCLTCERFRLVIIWVCYLLLVSLMEKASKTLEKNRYDSLLLLICRIDIPACHFLQWFS